MEKKKHRKKRLVAAWVVPGVIVLFLVGLVGFLVKIMMSDDSGPRRQKITSVTLLKPPAPEPPKEKLPEPEPPKEIPKQTIETPMEAPQQSPAQSAEPGPPAGADLGVDADGGAGGDGFGLVGKKGGRSITLGGGGGTGLNRLALNAKYGWYTQKVQDEIKRQVRKTLESDGGVPKGKLQATIKIEIDGQGVVRRHILLTSSGNRKMDDAVRIILAQIRISEPPPEGMPKAMTLKIISQG
jgi:outer membrane biosynthesis protein TonB